ncbi:baseplate J/gp47 family protein [Candidatus Cardinium hertigii]|uniref:Uncharacterized protein n=1 Tax=Candidatus Cardinium hertigii TaxID=247481 RepID=A0A3N2QD02_9BACT|nr:baseplate J/gp47 family protein [Candidatus Cardinium hertigii]ROT47678.1 hypothetical protein EDM02_00990 [Candidatus Cardinium hertigii]
MNIQKKFKFLFTRGGTCHTERLLPELIDNHLLISDRQFSDHLRFMYLYTDLLAYYDTNNEKIHANIWRKFLEQDNTVIRSLILHTNIDTLKKNIHREILTLRLNRTGITENKYVVNILVIAQELIILLDYWYNNLSNEDSIRAKLDAIIHAEINTHISKIYKILQQSRTSHYPQSFVEFCTFLEQKCYNAPLWELRTDLIYNEVSGPDQNDEQAIDMIADFFDAIFNTIYQLKELSTRDYFDTLTTQDKEPHMALLIAFLQLLQYADAHLNNIPQRSLDHYYRHVLKFNNNPAIPDQAYIHFLLSPNNAFAFVPKGSRLVAKNPVNGEDILFKTNRNITINTAKISQINTLLFNKKFAKEGYKMIELSTITYNSEMLKKFPFQLFPTLENNTAKQEQPHQPLATMVSSPLLHLAEGMRTIHIKWKLTAESFQALINKNPNKTVSSIAFLEQLADRLNSMVHIQITTKAGWLSIPEEAVSLIFIHEVYVLHMTISLNLEIPAMDKLPVGQQEGTIHPDMPTISIGMREGATSLMGLYFLNDLVLERIDLKVSVAHYRGLILQNQLGLIDNSQIFEPFGPLAKIDSSFYIGSGEIFSKNLTSLKIHIKWEGIPTIAGGFKRYYDAYPTKVQNDDFKVNISYLNHQHWNPSAAQNRQYTPLFQVIKSNNGSERLDQFRTISDIDIAALGITKTNDPLDVSVYGPHTISGFLKLQLSVPEQAFGHAIYPNLASSILVKNAQKKKEEAAIVLHEPYTPRIKSITVDYEAEESIVLTTRPGEEEEKYLNGFFHISPFGYLKLFPSSLASPVTLLPLIEEEVSFIAFGIESLNSSSLSMHIAIGENSLNTDKEIPSPKWFYLFDNIWLPLEEAIIVDGTNGLSKSGIIIFDLPHFSNHATGNNTYMAPGLTWIKVQFRGEINALPPIIGVYIQAVAVTRIMDRNGVFSSPVLPEKAMQQLQQPIEGVELVVQPFKTFGGRPFENHQALYRRVSERLRHKNRAVSVWDYERIILEKFPEIFRVKCINHTVKNTTGPTTNLMHPGHITIVVIAKEGRGAVNRFPTVNKQLLAEIKTYIQSVSTPFIKCEIVNPVYEDVKVNVTVKFKPGHEKGLFLNVLQQDVRNFLSPWLCNASADIALGGDIPTSQVIDFINSRYYIEGIGNFSIFRYLGKAPNLKLDKVTNYNSYLCASYPWSVMVSAKNHKISVVDKFDAAIKLRHGSIGDMAIGEDFIIGPLDPTSATDPIKCIDEDILIPSLEEYCLITQKHLKTDHGN